MAKVRNKKVKKVSRKKTVREDDVRKNPFEVRVNRRKHDVLGRKTERNEHGLPGVSRSRAIEKRKKTLLIEYKNRHKTKNLQDKRFGEKDETLTQEEKNIQRQIKLAESAHRKKNIYNLEEDDLTHYGQSIGDIETFDELQLSSDDEHRVDDTETHFGGFLKKKSELLSSDGANDAPTKTRKQAIEELVIKSKQHKFERQKEKEKVEELLEAVNNQWSSVQSLMTHRSKKEKTDTVTYEQDDFDQIVKELESEPRAAVASDKMKTQEEKVQMETKRFKNLEEERDRRMTRDTEGGESGMECTSGDMDIGNHSNANKVGQSEILLSDHDEDCDMEDTGCHDDDDSDIPDVSDVSTLLSDCSPSQCESTLNDLIAKLSSNNNTNDIKVLFDSTLEYCLSLAESLDTVAMEIIHNLAKPLFRMCQSNPAHCVRCIHGHLKQSFKRYQKSLKKDTIQYPINKDVILFKVVETLFPMSDFHHPVTTPTLQLMTLAINKNDSESRLNRVIRKSFVCQILIKSISLSKRYIPELLNYLTKILDLYNNDKGTNAFSRAIEIHGANHKPLSLSQLITKTKSLDTDPISMLSLLHVTVKQIHQLSCLWESIPLYNVIFHPLLTTLRKIEVIIHNSEIKAHLMTTTTNIEHNCTTKSLPILQLLRQKPKSIRFFEPSIDMDYQPGKRKYSHKSAGEKLKLKYKHKRELKGAIREIRKDSKFLAKERIKEQAEKDEIRKKKVKQIDGWLQQEKGEARAERFGNKRKNKKKN